MSSMLRMMRIIISLCVRARLESLFNTQKRSYGCPARCLPLALGRFMC